MKRNTKALGALLVIGVAIAVSAPAAAGATGNETFKGVIVTSGSSGERLVVSSVVVGHGVFDGVGRDVEIANLPTDPDNVTRDDLVFADGSIHIVSTIVDASFSLNPQSCVFSATVQQTGTFAGGTGRFAAAAGSYTGTVIAHGLAGRNPDGSCSEELAARHEVDLLASNGSLSF